MKLEDVVVGKDYRIKEDSEKTKEEYEGNIVTVVNKDVGELGLPGMMLGLSPNELVECEDETYIYGADLEPIEEEQKIEVGDTVRVKENLTQGVGFNGYVNNEMESMAGRKAKVVDNCPCIRTNFSLDIDDGEWSWSKDMLEVVEDEVLEVGDKITDGFHTGELINKFDEKDHYGKDAVFKFYDKDDGLTYVLITLDRFESVEKRKENLEKGDKFILDFIFSDKTEHEVLDKNIDYNNEVVYFAKDTEGEIRTVKAKEIDELV